jgi:hypothetical protein
MAGNLCSSPILAEGFSTFVTKFRLQRVGWYSSNKNGRVEMQTTLLIREAAYKNLQL